MNGNVVIHMAPPAERVPLLIRQLLIWLQQTDLPPLIGSCVFHYEFEFIHPFACRWKRPYGTVVANADFVTLGSVVRQRAG
ncbi:Fic family protein [uncultured Serratia sp.]